MMRIVMVLLLAAGASSVKAEMTDEERGQRKLEQFQHQMDNLSVNAGNKQPYETLSEAMDALEIRPTSPFVSMRVYDTIDQVIAAGRFPAANGFTSLTLGVLGRAEGKEQLQPSRRVAAYAFAHGLKKLCDSDEMIGSEVVMCARLGW